MRNVASKLILISFATAGVFAFGVAGSAQAVDVQRSLPQGNQLYAIPCHVTDPILELVNTADSTWTDVGVSHNIADSECAYQPAFNPVTQKSYFLAGNNNGDNGDWPLVEVSTVDGSMVNIGTINSGGTFATSFPGNIIITNSGVAYFIGGNVLYPLNLANASLGAPVNVGELTPGQDIYAAACSPVAAECYVLDENGGVYALDVTTGTVGSLLGTLPVLSNYSLQVDSTGILWSSSNGGALASFDPADPAGTYVEGNRFPLYSGALLLTLPTLVPQAPTPTAAATGDSALATTGINSTNMGLLAGGAVLIALVGIGLAWATRRRKTT